MGQTIFEKIIAAHQVSGERVPGKEVAIKIDQTLVHDSLGPMAYLQFEAMQKEKIATELSIGYTDHLMLQLGEGNGDVHRYMETFQTTSAWCTPRQARHLSSGTS
jgi:aconitate hydratase